MFLKKMSEINDVFKKYTPAQAKRDKGNSGQGYFVQTLKHYIPTIKKFVKFRTKQHVSSYNVKQNYLNLTPEYP